MFNGSSCVSLTMLSLIFFSFLVVQTQAWEFSQNLSCSSGDLSALLDFSNALDSRIDGRISHGPSTDCCSWVGVRCQFLSPENSNVPVLRVVGLDLGEKGLTGMVSSSLGSLDKLSFLNLSHNSLQGPLPEELFGLQSLEVLELSSNNFSGELGMGIRNLSSLLHLGLSSNAFTGIIPDAFHGMKKLENISANSNKFSGRLPASLLSCSTLRLLDLGNNSLSGFIDRKLTGLVRLSSINLGSNGFSGPIPDLSSCKALKFLNLARNNLSGQIPTSFKTLQSLSFLSLSGNILSNLSGALSMLQECRNLTVMVLTNSFRGEEMPDREIQEFPGLKVLVIANCALTGSIPSWLGRCKELSLLDLSWNQLSGVLPLWIGDLDSLFYLDLSNNSLSGKIPLALTELKSLTFGDFSLQNESSHFPMFSKRKQTGMLQYNRFANFPLTLDLSDNTLNGTILKEFGNLKFLMALNLGLNNFSGSIPDELSGMNSIELMDLSFNNLSGSIPSSFVKLTFLSSFSVAYNNLHGTIPSAGQFSTFPSSSFEGNPGLCGEYFLLCNSTKHLHSLPPPSQPDSEESGTSITGLPFVIGVLFGLVYIIVILIATGYFRKQNMGSQCQRLRQGSAHSVHGIYEDE